MVQLSPLYHGVALVRDLNLGRSDWAMLAHVAVLVGLAVAGLVVASRRIALDAADVTQRPSER